MDSLLRSSRISVESVRPALSTPYASAAHSITVCATGSSIATEEFIGAALRAAFAAGLAAASVTAGRPRRSRTVAANSPRVFRLLASWISMVTFSRSSISEIMTIIFMDSLLRSSRISVESVRPALSTPYASAAQSITVSAISSRVPVSTAVVTFCAAAGSVFFSAGFRSGIFLNSLSPSISHTTTLTSSSWIIRGLTTISFSSMALSNSAYLS